MIIPLWAILGMIAAFFSAATMLLQERLKVNGLALAVWCKIACVAATFPFVLMFGIPDDPLFYGFLAIQAVTFAISDVIWYRELPHIGAGVISRLFPLTVIIGFGLWVAIEPTQIHKFFDQPVIGSGIILTMVMSIYFAMSLRKCHLSMVALRKIWFVLLANITGPIVAMLLALHSNPQQGPWAYLFIEALMMFPLWLGYIAIKKPIPWSALIEKKTCQGGLIIGLVMVGMIYSYVIGFYYIDNPGYLGAVRLLDSVIIIAVHKYLNKHDESNIKAGLGIVACAVVLIILKNNFG